MGVFTNQIQNKNFYCILKYKNKIRINTYIVSIDTTQQVIRSFEKINYILIYFQVNIAELHEKNSKIGAAKSNEATLKFRIMQ